MEEKCFCHFNGYQVKDAVARKKLADVVSVAEYGAIGDGITDCTYAFKKAIDFCSSNQKKLYIPSGVYKISETLTINKPITIFGSGRWDSLGYSSTILFTEATGIRCARDNGNTALWSVRIENIALKYAGSSYTGSCAIEIKNATHAEISGVTTYDSAIGIKCMDTTKSIVKDCTAEYSEQYSAVDGINTFGFWLENNASLTFERCFTWFNCNGVVKKNRTGVILTGRIADVIIRNFESGFCNIGIDVVNTGTGEYDCTDVFILNNVLDTCGEVGIYLHDLSKTGSVNVTDNYISVWHNASPSCIRLQNVPCGATVSNNLMCNTVKNNTAIGIGVINAKCVTTTGNQIDDFAAAMMLEDSFFLDCCDAIKNNGVSAGAAVTVARCDGVRLSSAITGSDECFTTSAIEIAGDANKRIKVDTTKINGAAITFNEYGVVGYKGNRLNDPGMTSDGAVMIEGFKFG